MFYIRVQCRRRLTLHWFGAQYFRNIKHFKFHVYDRRVSALNVLKTAHIQILEGSWSYYTCGWSNLAELMI